MWRFREIQVGEPRRDPHEAEFFNTGNLDPTNSLVRESIQNSLDAAIDPEETIKVKFSILTKDMTENEHFFKELVAHLESAGLLTDNYNLKNMRLLIVEDFNTVGLDGNLDPDINNDDKDSNFNSFWWNEGKSKKEGTKVGRWGLGKIVYAVTSKLRSYWGYTIRYNDKRKLLMGKAVLKTHKHTDGKTYNYYAYFTKKNYYPIDDESFLEDFCKVFGVTRKNESGTSIIIPMPDKSIDEQSLLKAAISQYFFPIIKRRLIVEVSGKNNFVLTADNIVNVVENQDWQGTDWENRNVEELMEFIQDVATLPEDKLYKLKLPENSSTINDRINEYYFGDFLEQSIKMFQEGKLLAFKIPVIIQPEGDEKKESSFEVYIQKSTSLEKSDEFYIRSGIYVSEINMMRGRNVRALLYAYEDTVSKFLGDSESPSHTDWKERREDFKDKYNLAVKTLRYIRGSMRDIVQMLDIPPEGLDEDFLHDIFNVDTGTTGSGNGGDKEKINPPESNVTTLKINEVSEGFNILANDDVKEGSKYRLRVAYDVRRGNPFSKYNPLDFKLDSNDITIDKNGIKVFKCFDNEIIFQVEEQDFYLKVNGFDSDRDIIIDIREVKLNEKKI